MKFEVLTMVKMSMVVFWVVMMCGLIDEYHRFKKHTTSIFKAYFHRWMQVLQPQSSDNSYAHRQHVYLNKSKHL
jgi:hypothetical protein